MKMEPFEVVLACSGLQVVQRQLVLQLLCCLGPCDQVVVRLLAELPVPITAAVG